MFENKEDWKEFLCDDAKGTLSDVFETTKKHRGAYMQADDVKNAQLWCAIVELKKQIMVMSEMLRKVEEPFRAIVAIGEAEKRKAIEAFVTEIVKPEEEDEKVATQKLVDSLMRF